MSGNNAGPAAVILVVVILALGFALGLLVGAVLWQG